MRWYFLVPGVAAALVALVLLIGMLLPRTHVVTRRARVGAPPLRVWRLVTDIGAYARWRPEVEEVELLPPVNGRVAWRERGAHRAVTYEMLWADPPWRVAIGIADRGLPFGGEWAIELAPDGVGTLVTVVERGEVRRPARRFVARFVVGHGASTDRWLAALAGAVGTAGAAGAASRSFDPMLPAPPATETARHGA